ncbi:MAG: CDP-glycerol glycerophosphotransferase family protein, partial [Candidatus Micrarchaeia archaeon]
KNFLKELQHSTKKTYIISQFVRQMVCKILGLSNYDKYGSYCSKIVAWGDYGKELFIKSGINPKNIIVAGNPLFDDFIKIRFNKRKARKKIGVSQKVKLLLYASCNPLDINYWNKSEAEMHIRSINKITSKIKNCLLIIRPHPTEEESRYLEYLKGEDLTNTKVSKKEDFYTVLSACDILITEASLAGLEAAIFGKPVIIVNFIGKQYPTQRYPFILIKEQVALEARTEEDFFEKVKVLLKTNTALSKKIKHNRRKFIKRYVYRLDGRASERIAKIIEKTAKKTT